MSQRIYQVDAFTDIVFGGNPAAVMPLDTWLPDRVLQDLAAENNLAETAFFVPEGQDGYRLRWFTPTTEVDLCGHATLASAFVIMTILRPGTERVEFATQVAGTLSVTRSGDLFTLDFPSRPAEPAPGDSDQVKADIVAALGGVPPADILVARDYMVVYDDAASVAGLTPDFSALGRLDRAVLVTAPGGDVDFVSRFFAPSSRHPGRSRHRFDPLHADTVLGGAAGQDGAFRPAAFSAGRSVEAQAGGRQGLDFRHRRAVPRRHRLSLNNQ